MSEERFLPEDLPFGDAEASPCGQEAVAEEGAPKSKRRRGRRRKKGHRTADVPEIFFCGDPHGEFSQINEAARLKPAAMVILGDLQPPAPIDEVLAEAMALTEVWWIPGNHDTDTDEYYDRLWRGALAARNLHGRIANIAGLRIAGLGGVFRGQIWMPEGIPNYYCPATFIRRVGAGNQWRGGLPRRHRSTIFPSVYQNLLRQNADILVTHEAAGCHRKGFLAVDRLAKGLGVNWHFHGHQHEDRTYGEHHGVTVRAVGYRGVVNLKGEVIVPAQLDPREAAQLRTAMDWMDRAAEETLVEVRDPATGAIRILPPDEADKLSASFAADLLAFPPHFGDIERLGRAVAKNALGGGRQEGEKPVRAKPAQDRVPKGGRPDHGAAPEDRRGRSLRDRRLQRKRRQRTNRSSE